ncbi:hypothetical protein DYE50_01925 [Treponema ruminis]|uniref:Lipoprotein n=1 Tax=Treponema ruminis TaxID=744515 RepID=A0A7W8GAK4_9SPIR|nr:CsgG/HfaB family protein [Treponema ruminis]MBB5226914.1 hypothetical protein [Treponema ruminis]QSI01341.1 hypothetical protein DYE50_01925 [Treponema ruminis]
MSIKKKSFTGFMLFLLAIALPCFSENGIDETLVDVSSDICSVCSQNEIIAVLDFNAETVDMSNYLSNSLASNLSQNGKVRVVTRQHMDKIEKELDFQMSGYVSDSTALSICERLGAKAIIFGQFEELENQYTLQVKVLDVETAAYNLFKFYKIARSPKTEQLLGRAATYRKSAFGIIAETNKNCIEMIAPAGGISFDYSLSRKFSIGVKAFLSYDINGKNSDDNTAVTFEPLGSFRVYTTSPIGDSSSGMFIEGLFGGAVLFINDETKTVPSAGISLGIRQPFGATFIEPYLRVGYPYLFGAGLQFGLRF